MHICLIPEKYPPDPGGLAVSARRLGHGLAAQGHSVHVCHVTEALPACPDSVGARHTEHTTEDGVALHPVGACRRSDDTLADWFDAIVALHRAQPRDILHGYYLARASYVCVLAARYLGLPSVVSARGNDLERTVFDPSRAGAILWALANADAVTAVSADLARRAAALSGGRPVHVIPNGVDAALFAPAAPSGALATQLELGNLPTIGFVGEARLKKGLGVLLLAFERLARMQPVQLLLVGGVRDDDADVLNVFQRQHPGLPVRVVPHTPHERLPAIYNLLDVLVLPSRRDGLPNALLEGMACARPVVASAVGGILDVVTHGRDGLLTPPGDVEALTDTVRLLLHSPDRRRALGEAARQTVQSRFTIEREVAQNAEIYDQLVGSSS